MMMMMSKTAGVLKVQGNLATVAVSITNLKNNNQVAVLLTR